MDDDFAEATREPTVEAVQASLDVILACTELRLSERNRRFLSFVVSETVAGNAERIKAYTIGVDVFGRDDSFDPTTDPIVRIEATRVRSALATYYGGPGKSEPIRISMPPGSYVPAFSWAPKGCPAALSDFHASPRTDAVAVRHRTVVVVQDRSAQSDEEAALRGELFSDALLQFVSLAGLKVHLVPSSDRSAARAAIQRIFSSPERAFSLDIAVRPMAGQRRYSWRFSDLSTGEVLAIDHSDHSDHDVTATPCLDVIDKLALRVAQTIATLAAETERQEASGP